MNQNTKNEFKELLEENGYNIYSYSGRVMYGKKCLAFDFDGSIVSQMGQIVTEIINWCYDNYDSSLDNFVDRAEEFFDLLSTGKTDNMGLGTVLYFPSIEWADDWRDSDAEDDDE